MTINEIHILLVKRERNMKRIEYYNMLKPCPKCNSKHLRVTHWKTIGITTRFAVDCYDCDYKIESRNKRRVLKKWGINQPQTTRGNRSKIIERFD